MAIPLPNKAISGILSENTVLQAPRSQRRTVSDECRPHLQVEVFPCNMVQSALFCGTIMFHRHTITLDCVR